MAIIIGIILAIFVAIRLPKLSHPKRWLMVLAVPLLAGSIALIHALYWFHRTDCGQLYNSDIGCANAGGGWDVILGLGAGMVFLLVCVVLLIVSYTKKQIR
jgi:hypothetical protein